MYSVSASSVRRSRRGAPPPRRRRASSIFGRYGAYGEEEEGEEKEQQPPFRCYVPCMWSQCLLSGVALSVLALGACMAMGGLYGELYLLHAPHTLADHLPQHHPPLSPVGAKLLTYLGPVVMAAGCLMLIMSCTVVCETRDRLVTLLDKGVPPERLPAPHFHDTVVKTLIAAWQNKRQRELLRDLQDDSDSCDSGRVWDTVMAV